MILVFFHEFRAGHRVSYDFLGNIRFRVVLDVIILVLGDCSYNLSVSRILLLSGLDHLLQILLVLLHNWDCLLHKETEIQDVFFVLLDIADIVSLIDIEVLSVFLKNLKRSLPLHTGEDLVNLSLLPCEDTELLGLSEEIEFRELFHESL